MYFWDAVYDALCTHGMGLRVVREQTSVFCMRLSLSLSVSLSRSLSLTLARSFSRSLSLSLSLALSLLVNNFTWNCSRCPRVPPRTCIIRPHTYIIRCTNVHYRKTDTCTHTTHIRANARTRAHTHAHLSTHNIYTHTDTHTDTHTHTHTHTHSLSLSLSLSHTHTHTHTQADSSRQCTVCWDGVSTVALRPCGAFVSLTHAHITQRYITSI
jgi:hypothetical protein